MISVLTQPPSSIPQPASSKVADWSELASIHDATETFASLYRSTGQSVRLNCIFPTCHSRDSPYDLFDVQDIQTRSLKYLHCLVEELRDVGVPVSYTLSPSVTPLSVCLAIVIPVAKGLSSAKIKMSVCNAVRSADALPREKFLAASVENNTALIIT